MPRHAPGQLARQDLPRRFARRSRQDRGGAPLRAGRARWTQRHRSTRGPPLEGDGEEVDGFALGPAAAGGLVAAAAGGLATTFLAVTRGPHHGNRTDPPQPDAEAAGPRRGAVSRTALPVATGPGRGAHRRAT